MFSRIVRTYREYQELKYLAYHDALTGLLNRNWLYKNLDKIRTKYVYFIDINDLHTINESGHTFGDAYIKMVVDMLIAQTNSDDTLIRYAGDEFLLFSDYKNRIETNPLFTIGCSPIISCVQVAIQEADRKMIENKRLYKEMRRELSR